MKGFQNIELRLLLKSNVKIISESWGIPQKRWIHTCQIFPFIFSYQHFEQWESQERLSRKESFKVQGIPGLPPPTLIKNNFSCGIALKAVK